ncbi:MAG: PilZ domain-containing protein [Syntrophobacteraceae bacterium]|nr:PilZ domain-containing protein [Syntrophobacteraceae bacterium]
MEPLKVYVNERDEATIICSSCGKKKKVAAQQYMGDYKPIQVKCTCGFIFPIAFEKRKHYRKLVRIQGEYSVLEGANDKGTITIRDLSRTGVSFETHADHLLEAGHVVKLRFVLDDTDKTLITKSAEIMNVDGRRIGASFTERDFPKALAFYLMP